MPTFDKGPSIPVFDHFAALPGYEPHKSLFWYDWGPVFYRGRLDRSARLLCIASDPGPTERIAGRTLVGDAGQRVQGFLTKLGLTRSYLCINAFAYALFPSAAGSATAMLHEEEHKTWRNTLISLTDRGASSRRWSPSASRPRPPSPTGTTRAGCPSYPCRTRRAGAPPRWPPPGGPG